MGGGQHGSIPEDHAAFVDRGEQDGPEVDRPDPIVGFLEADVVLFQGIGDEEQLGLQPERAGVGHPLDQEVPRMLQRGQVLGKGARGGGVA